MRVWLYVSAGVLFLSGLACSCLAYPTSINYIPTAETVGAGGILFEIGNYGYPKALRSGSTDGLMTEFGIGPRLEIGADWYSGGESRQAYLNGKWRLVPEHGAVPGLAFGAMDVTREGQPSLYGIASKSIGPIRAHAGYLHASYSTGLILGADFDLGTKFWFGADYLPGNGNYARFGLGLNITSDSWVTLSLGSPNDRDVSDKEISVTFSRLFSLGRREGDK